MDVDATNEDGKWSVRRYRRPDRAAYKPAQLLAEAAAVLQARIHGEMPEVSWAEANAAAPRAKRTLVNRILEETG